MVGAAGILMALPVVLERRSRKPDVIVWPFVGFALGRTVCAATRLDLLSLCHVLTAWTGVVSVIYASRRPGQARHALRWMAFPLGIVALIQTLPAMQNTLINRNTLGMAIIPVLAAWLDDRLDWRLIVPVLALSLTVSRGAIIASALMVAWYYAVMRVAVPLTVAAVPVLMAVRNPSSVKIHANYWLAGIRGFLSSPLIGLGPARLGSVELVGHAHNILLTVASWSGITGLGLLGWGFWRGRQGWSMLPRWARAGVIGLALAGMVDDWSLHPLIMALTGALASSLSSN